MKVVFTLKAASAFRSGFGATIRVGAGVVGDEFGPIREAIAIAMHPAHIPQCYSGDTSNYKGFVEPHGEIWVKSGLFD